MRTLVDIRIHLRRNLPLLVGLSLFLYFSYHGVFGERSYARLSTLENTLHIKSMQLAALDARRGDLEGRVMLMRPDTLSADMVDEQVRQILGYQSEDELALLGN